MKDWRARADWETLIFLAGGAAAARGLPLIASVARDEAALLLSAVKLACWRAHSTLFVWMGRETPRKFCLCAGETSALYLYGTNMKLCEG